MIDLSWLSDAPRMFTLENNHQQNVIFGKHASCRREKVLLLFRLSLIIDLFLFSLSDFVLLFHWFFSFPLWFLRVISVVIFLSPSSFLLVYRDEWHLRVIFDRLQKSVVIVRDFRVHLCSFSSTLAKLDPRLKSDPLDSTPASGQSTLEVFQST